MGSGVPNAGSRIPREHEAVPRSHDTCAVCRRSRTRRSQSHASDVFICAQCCADAKQLIEIQESIWGEPGDASDSANEPDKPARREPPDAP